MDVNPDDRAQDNDDVLLATLKTFSLTIHTLKIILYLPHQSFLLLALMARVDMPILERLSIACPEDLFVDVKTIWKDGQYMSHLVRPDAKLRFTKLKILQINVMGFHPQQTLVDYCELMLIHSPVLSRIIIEAYPIMGIIRSKKGLLKWVKDLMRISKLRCLYERPEVAVPDVEIVPLIGDEIRAAKPLAIKRRLLEGPLDRRSMHGVIFQRFCTTVPSYAEWKRQ